MALRSNDPFDEHLERLDPSVNPYVNKIRENLDTLPIYFGERLRDKAGQWIAELSQHAMRDLREVYLEIGSYKGKTLIDYSLHLPNSAFIGMDITLKRVYISAQKAAQQGRSNCAWLLASGMSLDRVFADQELSGVFLFFPDPWQKKRQRKNRILCSRFCDMLTRALKPNGFFWFKTDCEEYFVEGQALLSEAGMRLSNDHNPYLFNITSETVFESLFKSQGVAIYSGIWYNNKVISKS